MDKDTNKIIEELSPLEIKIIPFLNLSIEEIKEKTSLDSTSVLRALKFLEEKGFLKVRQEKQRIVELGVNGIYYKKSYLPERKLLLTLEQKDKINLEEAKKNSKLSDKEFKASLGTLKNKSFIEIRNGRIFLIADKEQLSKKMPEEQFLETLPIKESSLTKDQKLILENLRNRKDIIEINDKTETDFELTELGKKISGKEFVSDSLEEVTPDVIKNWKRAQKFRTYNINSRVPKIFGGRKHFVSEAIEKGRRIWLDLGFKEISSTLTQTSFWNFDALFTAQDHPVRELQDTFYVKGVEGKLPEKKIVNKIKTAHESGVAGSKGWQYDWKEKEAKKIVLRTHTTCLSVQALAKLKKSDAPAKFFAIGRNFRNETVDWSHGFEFNQSEGMVVDKDVNFTHLLGYLKEFYKKMGFEKIKFVPAYFPYTEPSVEIHAFHDDRKKWLELGGAGIFRPEVVEPLLGEALPVLAWGPGFDRLMLMTADINDMREVYQNDINFLRERKVM